MTSTDLRGIADRMVTMDMRVLVGFVYSIIIKRENILSEVSSKYYRSVYKNLLSEMNKNGHFRNLEMTREVI